MKVYVVTWWNLDGAEETTEIMAVFSKRKKAYEYVEKHKGHPANNEWTVEERELDKEEVSYTIIEDDFANSFVNNHIGITHDPRFKKNQSSPIYSPIEDCSICKPKIAEREK